jgi:pimeloyl-ACP methyl ester carboxylesterase
MPKVHIESIYLLHGKGGSPQGSVSKLQAALEPRWPAAHFVRPELPHHDPAIAAETSVEALRRMVIPSAALLIGVSLGGMVAARFQELYRPDVDVVAISSPTWADGVRLETRCDGRLALYSSADDVIRGRTSDWPAIAEAYDLSWLSHDTDAHVNALVPLLVAFADGEALSSLGKL